MKLHVIAIALATLLQPVAALAAPSIINPEDRPRAADTSAGRPAAKPFARARDARQAGDAPRKAIEPEDRGVHRNGVNPQDKPRRGVEPQDGRRGIVQPQDRHRGIIEPADRRRGIIEPTDRPRGVIEPQDRPSGKTTRAEPASAWSSAATSQRWTRMTSGSQLLADVIDSLDRGRSTLEALDRGELRGDVPRTSSPANQR